ncbi:MAG TPA: FmdB family zinc ribbon protein [Candidatus Kapabacteria bacterium]|jgi:putative FmdB family regulatory protein
MPTYEYRCHFCHRVSDAFQKMSDAPLTTCPYCGKPELERIVTGGAGVIYKGEGWYVTDYSKKSSGGKESPPKESSAKESSAKESTAKESSAKETAAKTEGTKSDKADAPKTSSEKSTPPSASNG